MTPGIIHQTFTKKLRQQHRRAQKYFSFALTKKEKQQ
jgi:hypothetical protein